MNREEAWLNAVDKAAPPVNQRCWRRVRYRRRSQVIITKIPVRIQIIVGPPGVVAPSVSEYAGWASSVSDAAGSDRAPVAGAGTSVVTELLMLIPVEIVLSK